MIFVLTLLITVFYVTCDALNCGTKECLNGDCENEVCQCHSCYQGESCGLIKNKPPMFEKSLYKVNVTKDFNGDNILQIKATDEDTCSKMNCGCGQILYSILDDESRNKFVIDSDTGDIKLLVDKQNLKGEYSFTVKATNKSPFDNTYDTATILVYFENMSEPILKRYRRAVAPTTLEFKLTQTFPTFNLTTISVGQRLEFQVVITFPKGDSGINLEFFAPDNSTNPIMFFCNCKVKSNGSDLVGVNTINLLKQEGLKGNSWQNTHLVYNLTKISSNAGNPASISTIQIVFEFEVVMTYSPGLVGGQTQYISAGAEYLNGNQIWVSQVGYMANVSTVTLNPKIYFTGDTVIYPGRTALFDLVIEVPDPYINIDMEIYAPLNDTMALSMCIVNRYFIGAAFDCMPPSYGLPSISSTVISNKIYYNKATMNLGYLPNKYFNDSTHTDITEKSIKLKIAVLVNPNLWIGNYYYIGTSIKYNPPQIFTTAQSVLGMPPVPLNLYSGQIFYNLSQVSNSAEIGIPTKLILTISIPAGSELDYTITTRFLNNESEICGVSFVSAGFNIPCASQMIFSSVSTMDSANFSIISTTTIKGLRNIGMSNNTADNLLQFAIFFRPISGRANVGTPIKSGVTLGWTGGTGTEQTLAFQPKVAANITVQENNLPTFAFYLKGTNKTMAVGDIRQIFFSVRLQPGIIYGPSTLEFIMPFNNTIRAGFVLVQINQVGKNVVCFNPDFVIPKMVYSSKINDTANYDKLQIAIGGLCSNGPSGQNGTIDDEIQITITFKILTHSLNVVGAIINLNAGMVITYSFIWVGTQPLTLTGPQQIPPLTDANKPYIYGQRIDTINNTVFKNDLAVIQYLIKIAPSLTTSLNLTISSDITAANNFGVCQLFVKSQGSSVGYFIPVMSTTTWGPYSKYSQTATLSMPNILNNGILTLASTSSFDENSILIELVVKFGANIPSSFNVKADISYNGGVLNYNIPFNLQTTLSRFNGTISSTEPIFDMFLSPLFNDSKPNVTSIAYSEAMRSVVSIQTKPDVFQSLKIIFASAPSSMSQMDVISVNILRVGGNIPCLQPGMISYTTESRTQSKTKDMTNVDLGTICNRQLMPSNSDEDNKIYVEVVFRVWKFPNTNPSSLQINVIALNNNDQVYIKRIVFNTSPDTSKPNSLNSTGTIAANATVSPTSVSIGSIFNVQVTMGIPAYTQYSPATILVSSENPAGTDSFYFVAGNVNYTGNYGINIGINPNEPSPLKVNSTANTSQIDKIMVDFGILQNAATTYRMGQNNYSGPNADDTLSVLIPVKLTDNSNTANGFVIKFKVTTTFGTVVQDYPLEITVIRTNQETIDFNITSQLLTSNAVYTSSDPIIASVQAIMSNASKLECRNFTIYFAAPSFITAKSIFNSSYTSPKYDVSLTNLTQGGFTIGVPYFFYNEFISAIITMNVSPTMSLTRNRIESIITIPVIYACKTLNWPQNPSGNKVINKVNNLQFNVKGSGSATPNCNNDLSVNDSNVVKDCAISAFMSPFDTNGPLKIRSNSGSYWIPHIRSGQYNKLRYIDIRFGILKTVTMVIITSNVPNKPQKISIYGTMDGRAYSPYRDMDLTYTNNVSTSTLTEPLFTYRGIRIAILNASQDDQPTGLNIDLRGCTLSNGADNYGFSECYIESYSRPSPQLPEFYYRGFLGALNYHFICDELPSRTNNLETYPRCFRSNSSNTWEDLGNQVGKIIGFDKGTQFIYAIASDLKSYIMSEDSGLSWTGLNGNGWRTIKTQNPIDVPITIPWKSDTTFDASTTGASCTKYKTGTFSFCYDGVYSGSKRLFAWNDCCSL